MEYVFDTENFEKEVLKSDVPVLVDMFATWCGPCKMMSPNISAVAQEFGGRAKVGKLDIDRCMDLAEQFNVTAVPTVFLFKNGKVEKKLVGYQDKETLAAQLNALM